MTQEIKLKRSQCTYQPENARFLLECDFSKQYNHYYRKRLARTRPFLEYNARSKWDSNIPIYNLAEVATFSITEPLDDSDIGASPPPMTPPKRQPNYQSECLHTPTGGGYHKFPKRIRKLSDNSITNYPRTSTQNDVLNDPVSIDITATPIGCAEARTFPTPTIRRPANSNTGQCIVIGTIFKRMKLQPDVVEELSKGDFHVRCERYLGHYTSQDDTLVLEDTEESISLVGNINPKNFVTGICVAILGYSIDDGSQFLVKDICYAEPNRQLLYDDLQFNQVEEPKPNPDDKPIYLMVVSSLGFNHEMDKNAALTEALQNMIDFIWGGNKYSEDPRSHRVARILVLGNSLHEDRLEQGGEDGDDDQDDIATKMKQSRQVKQYSKSISAVKHMDNFFSQLSKTINVDVMPGPSDPSSHLLPQQPFHPCMFPKSCKFGTFNCTTNPHHAIYNNSVEVLATAGQNVDIIRSFSNLEDPIEIMKSHLRWGNSAPSAPDNLYSVPYEEEDPHVIDFIPEIYIAGCQNSYQRDYYYYSSDESHSSIPREASFQSYQTESTVINVTPESVQGRSTKSGEWRTPSPAFESEINSFSMSASTPKLACELNVRQSGSESSDRTPSSYLPNQLALQRRNEAIAFPKKSRTLIITVPKFCETYSCVLIDLTNLESHILSFSS